MPKKLSFERSEPFLRGMQRLGPTDAATFPDTKLAQNWHKSKFANDNNGVYNFIHGD